MKTESYLARRAREIREAKAATPAKKWKHPMEYSKERKAAASSSSSSDLKSQIPNLKSKSPDPRVAAEIAALQQSLLERSCEYRTGNMPQVADDFLTAAEKAHTILTILAGKEGA